MSPVEQHQFILHTLQVSKIRQVQTDGIGDRLPATLYAWRDSEIVAVASTDENESSERRLQVLVNCAFKFRACLGADAFTYTSEGYQSQEGTPTPARFATNDGVDEVLIALHVDAVAPAGMVTVRFQCMPGRLVVFADPKLNLGPFGAAERMLKLALSGLPGSAELPELPGASVLVS